MREEIVFERVDMELSVPSFILIVSHVLVGTVGLNRWQKSRPILLKRGVSFGLGMRCKSS